MVRRVLLFGQRVQKKNCYYCSLDSDCGTSEECCDGGDCSTFCSSSDSSSLTGAHTAGAVVGTMVFFAIVISCVACFCCTCCPYYRNRSPGTATDQQTLVSTTQLSAMSSEPVQHYPPSGPSPPNYSLPPPVTFNQPPPPNYNQTPPVTYNQPPSSLPSLNKVIIIIIIITAKLQPASTAKLQPASTVGI